MIENTSDYNQSYEEKNNAKVNRNRTVRRVKVCRCVLQDDLRGLGEPWTGYVQDMTDLLIPKLLSPKLPNPKSYIDCVATTITI